MSTGSTTAQQETVGQASKGANTTGTAFDQKLFKRVFAFTKPYRKLFWTTFMLTVVLAGLGVVRPLLMGRMIDDHAMTGDPHGLLRITLIIVGLLILEALVQFYQSYWTSWLGQAVTFDLRRKLFQHLLSFRLRWFDRTPIGTLVTRVVSDIETIEDIFSQGLLMIMGDILKLVVINRYQKAEPAIAFIHNLGFKSGAIASTVAHDSHNIIAAGTSDEEIARAINLLVESTGGIVLVNGEQEHLLPLPVAGLMSADDGYKTAAAYEKINHLTRQLGTQLEAPFMALSFMALLVIPKLKLSDAGLFDGTKFEFTSLFVDQ